MLVFVSSICVYVFNCIYFLFYVYIYSNVLCVFYIGTLLQGWLLGEDMWSNVWTVRAHSFSISSLIMIDGCACHNKNAIIKDAPVLVSGSEDKTVKSWNLYSGEPIAILSIYQDSSVYDSSKLKNVLHISSNVPAMCVFYPNSGGRMDMGEMPHLFVGTDNGTILCLNFEVVGEGDDDNVEECVLLWRKFMLVGHTDGVNEFALLAQNNHQLETLDNVDTFLLVCAADISIVMWDIIRNGTFLMTFAGHTGVVQRLCVSHAWESPDSETVIISGSWITL